MNSISDIRFNIVPPMPKQTNKPSNNVLVINVVEVENDENYPLNIFIKNIIGGIYD